LLVERAVVTLRLRRLGVEQGRKLEDLADNVRPDPLDLRQPVHRIEEALLGDMSQWPSVQLVRLLVALVHVASVEEEVDQHLGSQLLFVRDRTVRAAVRPSQ
jgi:hypothetical protein